MVWSSASSTLIGPLVLGFSANTPPLRFRWCSRKGIVSSTPFRAMDVRPFVSLFTQVRGETVWKIAQGLSSALLRRQEAADRGFFGPLERLRNPHFGAYPDFPNSFGRVILGTSC